MKTLRRISSGNQKKRRKTKKNVGFRRIVFLVSFRARFQHFWFLSQICEMLHFLINRNLAKFAKSWSLYEAKSSQICEMLVFTRKRNLPKFAKFWFRNVGFGYKAKSSQICEMLVCYRKPNSSQICEKSW